MAQQGVGLWAGFELLFHSREWGVLFSLVAPTVFMVSVIFIFPVFSVFFLLSRPATKFRKTPSQAQLSSANLLHGNPHRRVSKMYSFWYMVMISYGVYYSTISNGSGLADFFHGQDVNRIEQLLSLTPILKRGPTVPIWFQMPSESHKC